MEKVNKIAPEKPKKCRERGCIGTVDLNDPIRLRTSCFTHSNAFACSICGRLHWLRENKRVVGVVNRMGEKAFYKDGVLSNKPKKKDTRV